MDRLSGQRHVVSLCHYEKRAVISADAYLAPENDDFIHVFMCHMLRTVDRAKLKVSLSSIGPILVVVSCVCGCWGGGGGGGATLLPC